MKSAIIARLRELAHQDSVSDCIREFNDLSRTFCKLQDEEERQWEMEKYKRIEEGEHSAAVEAVEAPEYPYLNDYKRLTRLFNDKKKAEVAAQREVEKANLIKKQALIAALTDLIQNEENIGNAIARFKDIEESWKATGSVLREKRQLIQKTFSNLVESFRHTIDIYKELKAHDLRRNLQLKEEVIARLREVLELTSIKEMEEKLHFYQDEWNSIGGTHPDDWKKVKEEYWSVVNQAYQKIHAHYKVRREEKAANMARKKELIEQVRKLVEQDIQQHRAWKSATDELLAIQQTWKTIGWGTKEENATAWQTFRGLCDSFFARKKSFYDGRGEVFDSVKEKKRALVESAKLLRSSTDWKETTQQFIDLQKKWKALGSSGPKSDHLLWKELREHVDFFFEAKKHYFEQRTQAQKDNLEAKEQLVNRIEQFDVGTDVQKAVTALKAFSAEFSEIGNVHIKEKDRIYAAYKSALDKKYAAIELDRATREKALFEDKLTTILHTEDPLLSLERERQFIRSKINQLQQELTQYETNKAFFAHTSEEHPLLKEVNQRIVQSTAKLNGFKEQLKQLKVAEHAFRKAQQKETSDALPSQKET